MKKATTTARKLNAKDLHKLVKQIIKEEANSASSELRELLPASDEALYTYAKKVEDLITKFIKDSEDLRDEGSKIIAKDVLESAKVAERNRFILARIGMVGKLKNLMIQGLESLKRET